MALSYIARQVGRPVKWIEGRQENYRATTHGRDHIQDAEMSATRDGIITGLKVLSVANVGAYLSTFAPGIPTVLFGVMLSGPYRIPNIACDVVGVFTNTTPVDAFRGAGRPEAIHLVERMMNRVAAELGMDPAEIRRKNFIPPDAFPYTTATAVIYDSGNSAGALDKALEMAGYAALRREQAAARAAGRLMGIGFSSYVEVCGMAPSQVLAAVGAGGAGWESASVQVLPTGKVVVLTGSSAHGQGHETSFAQITSDRLGVPMEDVEVVHGDTSKVRYGVGTFGSRSAAVGGTALYNTLEKVREKARKIVAHQLEAAEDDIVFEGGKLFVRGVPDKAKAFQEVALAAHFAADLPPGMEPMLEATTFYNPENFTWPFGTHIAVVDVDRDTGKVSLRRYIAVDDVGNVINPLLVDGQVHGGIVQGIGQALFEGAEYGEDGQLLSNSMMDYPLTRADNLPMLELARTVTPSPVNPMGVKGVGEAGTIAASAAVVNAVVDALSPLGITHIDMPMRPERVWRAIQQAGR
ncbi:MAG: molybdopterin cofactor-binding domain-containing protein, partial [Chloroflexota bacterium]